MVTGISDESVASSGGEGARGYLGNREDREGKMGGGNVPLKGRWRGGKNILSELNKKY